MLEKKNIVSGIHQCITLTNKHWKQTDAGQLQPTGKGIIVLLHGHNESAHKIYRRLGHSLDEQLHQQSIIAINALYPLPKKNSIPSKNQLQTDKEFIGGYTWYFYDQESNDFIISYDIPVQTLCSFLNEINPDELDTSIIGYSQGGYLAPFLGLAYPHTKQVLGINCSFRHDLIKDKYKKIPFILNQIQGHCDDIIDTSLSVNRYKKIKKDYRITGEYQWVKDCNHWLSEQMREQTIKLFKKYMNT